jgi:hypothetical protein
MLSIFMKLQNNDLINIFFQDINTILTSTFQYTNTMNIDKIHLILLPWLSRVRREEIDFLWPIEIVCYGIQAKIRRSA